MLDEENKISNIEESNNSENLESNVEKSPKKITSKKPVEESEAINEIENKIAETAENTSKSEVEMGDYKNFTLEELIAELTKLVNEFPVQSIGSNITKIKSVFNVKFGELLKLEKEKFVAEGGNELDFQFNSPIKTNYNSILYDYKVKRNEYFSNQQKELKNNLKLKLELIEELKELIENGNAASAYNVFKVLQTRWQEIGPIPKTKYNDTWRTYHHHVERFYDLLHLSNDLRDLDFKHNYEEKLKLVAKAEELAELEDVTFAFNELQVLHKLWKEEVGPVAPEFREDLWERFSNATKKVHDKRYEFIKEIKSQFDDNVDKKLAVIKAIEEHDTTKNKSRSDWQKSINTIDKLRKEFFEIGQVPRAKSNLVWNKFKEVTKKFNAEKNEYFRDEKKEQLENLAKKKVLVEQAVSLKESEDWELTANVMKKIQADWKNIGHVPRKFSDKIWKEFKDACNHFFDRLHKHNQVGNKQQLEVFSEKKNLLAEIKEAVADDDTEITKEKLNEYVSNWRSLGRVPAEMKHIEVKFNKLLDKIADESSLKTEDVEMIKFANLMNSYLEQKNYRKLDSEQLFIRKKIDETIREIQQLENNIGFISNVTEDNPLVKNVRVHINEYKEKLELWKTKLDYLKAMTY